MNLVRSVSVLLFAATVGGWLVGARASPPSPQASSICEIAKAGRSWAGKSVRVRAQRVVNANGGKLRDDRCPEVLVELQDDEHVEVDDLYRRFQQSFDRQLLSVGVARERVELLGTVAYVGRGQASPQGSALKLKRVISFDPEW